MSTWTTYFQAAATTAGTLVGLVFVAVSLSPTSLLTELRAGLRARGRVYLCRAGAPLRVDLIIET